MVMRFPCYDFSAARYRAEPVRLAPPLRAVCDTPIDGVGYLPLFAHGRLFFAYKRGVIGARDAESLRTLWEYDFGTRFAPLASKSGASLLVGDTLVVATDDALVLLDTETGTMRERQPMTDFDLWGAAIVGKVLVGQHWDHGRQLAAYDLEKSRLVWQRPIGVDNALLASDVGVVCRLEAGAFAAVDLASGADRWTYPVAELGRYLDARGATVNGEAMGRPIIFDGAMIGSVIGHHVIAIDLASGTPRWTTRLEIVNTTNLSCSASGEIIVIGDRSLHTLDARTGAMRGQLDLSAALDAADVAGPFSRPGITDEYFYCGDYRGSLIAIERRRGTIEWKTKCRARVPGGYAPLVIDKRLYAVDLRGNFYAFDGEVCG
jgi:outer membrane protein assembly factor BamB